MWAPLRITTKRTSIFRSGKLTDAQWLYAEGLVFIGSRWPLQWQKAIKKVKKGGYSFHNIGSRCVPEKLSLLISGRLRTSISRYEKLMDTQGPDIRKLKKKKVNVYHRIVCFMSFFHIENLKLADSHIRN